MSHNVQAVYLSDMKHSALNVGFMLPEVRLGILKDIYIYIYCTHSHTCVTACNKTVAGRYLIRLASTKGLIDEYRLHSYRAIRVHVAILPIQDAVVKYYERFNYLHRVVGFYGKFLISTQTLW